MNSHLRQITGHYFGHDSLASLAVEDLQEYIGRYPYAAHARYLLAQKKFEEAPGESHAEIVTAGLYIHNPLWLHRLFTTEEEVVEPAAEPSPAEEAPLPEQEALQAQPHEKAASTNQEPIAFQSYHTIDYFASQGIRLQAADLTRDKLGQQLKSFTEWLRSMKKLPSSEVEATNHGPDENIRRERVILSAANSIEEKEVFTEAMAEVWEKQGNTARAIDIYHKLSLQNPDKSAYFAAKIDRLK